MPLHAARPLVHIEHDTISTIETRNPENLFGLWSVLKTCSPVLQDGRRYENLAWRLWGRETQCCLADYITDPKWAFGRAQTMEPPELSSSVGSDDSVSDSAVTAASRSNCSSRPELRRHDSANSQARGKHITPIDLEKVVNSIQEKRAIEPLSPLPAQLAPPVVDKKAVEDITPRPSSPPPAATPARCIQDSTSTVATAMDSTGTSPPMGSDVSASTDLSAHSVVHGFNPARISTSVRSSTNLNPTPILKNAFVPRPPPSRAEPMRKKQPMFTLGGSSDEDNSSSFEAYSLANRSSLSDNIKKAGLIKKTASFKNEVSTRTIHDIASESENAAESAIESDSDESDNAIEEEEEFDEDDWEDEGENEDSVPASVDERPMFQRVDSRPNLVSRRSLLTTMMHQGDRAQALQNAASRSQPAIRRSRTSTPNGPSTGSSPQEDSPLMMKPTRSKPIIMTTSNVHPPMLSPRTTRRNMLQTELTQSLRQNLLWERQQKNSAINAVNKRVQSAASIPALRRAMTTNDIKGMEAHVGPQQSMQQNMFKSTTFRDGAKNNSYNDYFDQGLQEYHQKGW
ncbi:DUF1752-domain-containing protein [Massarina eburnea CBS 473.64]|uniref:DUF1752-domain-containing protein n=1 Tax=Massarina eburnea CBS 473.64 TaxID=1395130 RepID=A0A6A6RG91_9PLEO|nr:DUF1752-domain-containing protein [Massarina eburnea CBS 473.64]